MSVAARPRRVGSIVGTLGLWLAGGLAAVAQPVATFQAPDILTVLQPDPDGRVLLRPDRPDLAPAIPVPQVMNGGAYGLSGVDYYFDEPTEGRLGGGKRPRTYVLAPAIIGPLGPFAPAR